MCVNDSGIILLNGHVQVDLELQQETVKDQIFTMSIYLSLSS